MESKIDERRLRHVAAALEHSGHEAVSTNGIPATLHAIGSAALHHRNMHAPQFHETNQDVCPFVAKSMRAGYHKKQFDVQSRAIFVLDA